MKYPFQKICRTRIRRGSTYVAVMGVAMIVSLIGLATMHISRLQLRSTRDLQNLEEARLLSQSGVEFGLSNISALSSWRTDMTHGVELTPALNLGNGTMTYSLVDDDGDLADDPTDRVRIQGIGRVGEAVYVTRVLLEPSGGGLTALETSLHVGGDLVQSRNGNITTNQMVSSNGNINKSSGSPTVTGDAWAVGTINLLVSGTSASNQTPPKEMPDPATVFDYYVAHGTQISMGSIALQSIDKVVISPGNNPYGATLNPLGIYVIDCQGVNLKIKDSRIQGTLVLLNVGPGTKIEKDIHWEPAVANYPALLVQGGLEMKWRADRTLHESELGINFNPAHTPYQGVSDTDMVDTYAGVIKGLIYVSGNLAIKRQCRLEGVVVVGGAVGVDEGLTLMYDGSLLSDPPPGFSAGSVMQIVPGTWTRIPY